MKVSSHNISFSSTHTATSSYLRRERLEVWQGENPHRQQNDGQAAQSAQSSTPTPDASQLIQPDRVEKNVEAKKNSEKSGKAENGSSDKPNTPEELELKILIESVSAILENTDIKFRDPSMDRVEETYEKGEDKIEQVEDRPDPRSAANQEQEQADWGLRYDSYERYEEQESLSFEAGGTVKTKDGREIDFSVSLEMQRKFVMESETHIRAGNAQPIDPLVINYDGNAAELSEDEFKFDLNMDGTLENLKTLEAGSGFLAMDKNENGSIDDGSELFGPKTGNGFEELATYDQDGNRFIDEADDAYSDLYLMTPQSDGSLEKQPLEELNVGAIFLGSSDTSFSFKNQLELEGQLRRSGIYLKENGEAGTVQQIDLVPQGEKNSRPPSSMIDVSG